MAFNSEKIYPQSITGKYRTYKDITMVILLLIYYLSSWLRWDRGASNPDQALLIDMQDGRGYIFNLMIWPDEVYYITAILIMAAIGLFFFTTLYGRLWCGFTCPHTLYTDIFLKIENFFEGDRNERLKLDNNKYYPRKRLKKFAKHITWLIVSFSFAFAWVCYFYDSFNLTNDLLALRVTPGATCWLLGLTCSTYLIAGFTREKICIYMCPYGRFQSAMLDNDTKIVTYNSIRGEPRGYDKQDSSKHGDCINCNKCVVVCPMGIDIRDGLQMECIGCGLCIDACNSVMHKIGRDLDLIAYDSINSSKATAKHCTTKPKSFKFKTSIFALVFVTVLVVAAYQLSNRAEINVILQRERGPLYTILPDGNTRNTYNIKLFNRNYNDRKYILYINGNFLFKDQYFSAKSYINEIAIDIKAGEEYSSKIFVKNIDNTTQNSNIKFIIIDDFNNKTIVENSFIIGN